MRVKKYLALLFAAILATTMLTGCPWDIEDDTASDSSGAPSSSSRPSHDSDSSDDGSVPSSPSTPDDEESEKPDLNEIFKEYGTINGDTLTITNTDDLGPLNESFLNALNNTSDITTIAFNNNIKSIPDGAFDSCTNLTSIDLGSVTYIKTTAFKGCTSLTSIDLSKVETIGQQAFDDCTSLTSVDLTSATRIDYGAFLICTNLAHIRLGDGMKEYSDGTLFIEPTGVHPDAFDGIAKTVHVYYGKTAEEAEEKWTSLNVTPSGTQVEYHPDSEWENRENDDNAAEALPDAMKSLLALTERLG